MLRNVFQRKLAVPWSAFKFKIQGAAVDIALTTVHRQLDKGAGVEVVMKKSDFIVVTLKNNNSAFIEMENRCFETSLETAKSIMTYAKNNYKEVARTTNNGDTTVYFN